MSCFEPQTWPFVYIFVADSMDVLYIFTLHVLYGGRSDAEASILFILLQRNHKAYDVVIVTHKTAIRHWTRWASENG